MNDNEVRQPALKVGAILRNEREARGLSVEEIAERVKYSVRQVEALEHDEAEHLPEGTFLRGFVRSYARVLGMDESKLLEATHTQTEHHFDVTDVQAGGAPLPVTGDANRRSRYLLLSALAVAILLAGFVWSHRDDVLLPATKVVAESPREPEAAATTVQAADAAPENPPLEKTPESIKPVEEQKPEPIAQPQEHHKPAVDVKPTEPPKPGPVVKAVEPPKQEPVARLVDPSKVAPAVKQAEPAKPVPAAKPVITAPQVERKEPPAAPAETATEEAVSPPKPAVPLAQLMKRPIHIVFNEEAWMEIIDVNGEILLSRVTKAGEEKWIGGGHRAPYSITIGKPGAIRMYYHGKEVDLSQYNPAGVAKLVLE
ncbi:MAG: DUF4115 domain-containing protein [Sideroxydans sp.]|nr:DUF4115 domain-containing protein [Sideroxydans sp.]